MRSLILLTSIIAAMLCCSSALWAYTVSFDDVPVGQDLSYYHQQYGLHMVPGWEVVDSVASGWGTPQSGTQSVVWNGNPVFGTGFGFYFVDGVSEYKAQYAGAYFTTQPGVVLEMHCLVTGGVMVANIGDANGSWSNRYVEISSAAGDIRSVFIVGISSPDARYHFSMDDLTVVPVPEPSSLLALVAGLVPLAGLAIRRRK